MKPEDEIRINTISPPTVQMYPEPAVNRAEALRYAGVKGEAPDMEKLLDECIAEAGKVLEYKTVYCECEGSIVFAATIGLGMDRLIEKYKKISPAKAIIMSGLGSERVESLCDAFCNDMKSCHPDRVCRQRVSPGYGKWPLSLQTGIFNKLNVTKNIGIVLNDNLFMTPTKSVTAIIYYQ